MSKSKGNSEAIALQREALEESRRTNNLQLEALARQTAALERTKLPAYKPPSPPPTPGTSGADYAGGQQRLAAKRRFGIDDTVLGGRILGGLNRAA